MLENQIVFQPLNYIYIGIITEFDASQERAQILGIGILLVQSIRNF